MVWTQTTRRDATVGALTPEGIEFVLFPAGLLVRACAYGIDKIIQWLILLLIGLAAALYRGVWLMLILNFCVEWFYHVIGELAFGGQSFGKRIMGIRVVRNDGAPVDAASSLLRNLLRFADTFLFLFPIALLVMAASSAFRRLGDWAGGTLVVYTPKAMGFPLQGTPWERTPFQGTPRQGTIGGLDGVAPVLPPHPLSHEEKQAALLFARRYPLVGAARANEIAGPWARCLRSEPGNSAPDDCSDAAYLLGIARVLSGGGIPHD
jgi:uncharacterized RDD family membrane protein YckC